MDLTTQSIRQAALVGVAIRSIEKRLAWAKAKGLAEGAAGVVEAASLAESCASALHSALEVLAEVSAARLDVDPKLLSGGDDKPEDDPPGGP